MKSTTASSTIEELRKMFAAYGLPSQVVMDNGTQIVSEEFATVMKQNGIKHVRCASYHPLSNGAVNRFVQTLKRVLKAGEETSTPRHSKFLSLLAYCITAHATMGVSPCQLFMGRQLQTCFDLLHSDREGRVKGRQAQQKAKHDKHAHVRELHTGE